MTTDNARTPAWTTKLGTEDKTTFAKPAPAKRFFKLSLVEGLSSLVSVNGKIRRADIARQMLLQLPPETDARLTAAVKGAQGPAVVALIEFALDALEKDGKTLFVENRE